MDFPGADIYLAVIATLWGAIWGSFSNVAIYRLPRGLSLLRPSSRCPSCNTPIRWYHNVPVLGYLVLRGKCHDCKEPISIQYPLVELIVSVLALAVWQRIAMNPDLETLGLKATMFLFQFTFVLGLVIVIFADLETMLIPDEISITGTVLGLVAALVTGPWGGVDWLSSLIGALAGAGVIWGVRFTYRKLFGIEGMGFGDVKLMAMIGAFLGWESLVFVFLFGSVQGLIYAAAAFAAGKRHEIPEDPAPAGAPGQAGEDPSPEALAAAQTNAAAESPEAEAPALDPAQPVPAASFRKMPIPFGPFLSLAALEWLFFQDKIIELQRNIFLG